MKKNKSNTDPVSNVVNTDPVSNVVNTDPHKTKFKPKTIRLYEDQFNDAMLIRKNMENDKRFHDVVSTTEAVHFAIHYVSDLIRSGKKVFGKKR